MALIDKYRNLLNRADTAIDKRASQLRQAYSQRIAPRQSLSKPNLIAQARREWQTPRFSPNTRRIINEGVQRTDFINRAIEPFEKKTTRRLLGPVIEAPAIAMMDDQQRANYKPVSFGGESLAKDVTGVWKGAANTAGLAYGGGTGTGLATTGVLSAFSGKDALKKLPDNMIKGGFYSAVSNPIIDKVAGGAVARVGGSGLNKVIASRAIKGGVMGTGNLLEDVATSRGLGIDSNLTPKSAAFSFGVGALMGSAGRGIDPNALKATTGRLPNKIHPEDVGVLDQAMDVLQNKKAKLEGIEATEYGKQINLLADKYLKKNEIDKIVTKTKGKDMRKYYVELGKALQKKSREIEPDYGFADKMFGKLGIVDNDPLIQEARKYKSAEEFINNNKFFRKGEEVGFAGILSPEGEARKGKFVRKVNDHLVEIDYGDHKELNHINNIYKLENNTQPTKGVEALAEEARKYKSAEEFVRKMERGRATWGTSTVRINPIQNAIDHTPFVGKPGKEVEIFRVTPGNIEAGDFVFTSREAAEKYMKTQGSTTPGSIKSMKVDSSEIAPAFDAETQINNRYIGSYLYKKDRKPSFSSVESIYVPKSVQGIDLTDIWNKANQPINSPYSMGIVGNSPVKPDLTKDIGGEAKKFEDYLKGNQLDQQTVDEINLKNILSDEEKSSWSYALNQTLNPIRNAPKEVQDVMNKWRGGVLKAKQMANAEVPRFSQIPEEDGYKIVRYIQEPTQENAMKLGLNVNKYSNEINQLRSYYDNIREEALNRGLDVGYVENYLNQVWKESPAEVAKKAGLSGNPAFTKEKMIPDYQTGIKLGLTPRFTHPAQLAAHYRLQLEKASANQQLVNDLIKSNYLLPAKQAPIDWKTIESPLAGGLEGYKASPSVAKALNNMFDMDQNRILGFSSKVSRGMQDISLTGGVGPINSFVLGNTIKEFTAGRFKSPISSWLRSWSGDSTRKYFAENKDIVQKMTEDGLPLRANNDYTKAFKNLAESRSLKDTLGDGWNLVFNEATFSRFMPMLQTNLYKDVYEKGIKDGLNEKAARQIAADTTRRFYGVIDNFTRSSDAENAISTLFFAPKFRESMVNFWGSNAKALDPRTLKDPTFKYNRRFLAGTAVTFGLMNALNYALNGRWLHENKDGKELSLEIPVGEGRSWYIPMLPSVATLPRRAVEMGTALAGGDTALAAERAGTFLSTPLQLGMDLASNRTFYGAPIYDKEDDSALTKIKKQVGYAGEQSLPGFIGEPIAVAQGRKTPIEGVIGAMEMPVYPSSSTEVAGLSKKEREKYLELSKTNPSYAESYKQRNTYKPKGSSRGIVEPVNAMETQPLPQGEDLKIYFKDLRKDVDGARSKRVAIQNDYQLTQEEKDQKMEELSVDIFEKSKRLKQIKREQPFEVFKIELEENSSGNVEKRGDWAMEQIAKFAKEGKQKDIPLLLEVLWDNKVLTSGKSGTAAYIAKKYGVDTTTKRQLALKNKGKKIKKKEIKLEKLQRIVPKVSYKEVDSAQLDIPTFNPPTTLSGNSLGSFTPSANLEKIRRSSLTR